MSTPSHRTAAPPHVPAGASADKDGIVVGSGPVTVDAYIDFLCPYCKMFEQASRPTLHKLVEDGVISLVYHPMGFLDGLSTDRYSSRASASSGCASDGGKFVAYASALFTNQPPEGGPGLSGDDLVEIGALVGLTDPDFGACVRNGTYLDWTAYVTDRAIGRGVSGTPTVLVGGTAVPASPQTIVAAVASAVR
ncbi:thioredoxin domain-containing protein [Streptosporangium sp. CA-135522]|uniref:DsbA family protein n=1 Tax=Streptosporangium sp. CA-135522 TaxID=3240072 RepID=UPI003D8EFF09